jgi:hypothetical protein
MATTAIQGVVAAGRVPAWIIPAALVAADPVEGTWSIPLADLTDPTVVKIDCHMDAGDFSMTRTPTTKSRQRMCQVVAETVKTGETIDVTISAVYDQQEAMASEINEAYAALPEDEVVYVALAFGWDSSVTPTVATVIDLVKGTVQSRDKNFPTTIDEDLKFTAVLSGSAYFQDVALTGP